MPLAGPVIVSGPVIWSGLQIRFAKDLASGLFHAGVVRLRTTSELCQSCGPWTLDTRQRLDVLVDDTDSASGLLNPALLGHRLDVAAFNTVPPDVCASVSLVRLGLVFFPYGCVRASALCHLSTLWPLWRLCVGYRARENIARPRFLPASGDAGGRSLDSDGACWDACMPRRNGARELPKMSPLPWKQGHCGLAAKGRLSAWIQRFASTAVQAHTCAKNQGVMTVLVSC